MIIRLGGHDRAPKGNSVTGRGNSIRKEELDAPRLKGRAREAGPGHDVRTLDKEWVSGEVAPPIVRPCVHSFIHSFVHSTKDCGAPRCRSGCWGCSCAQNNHGPSVLQGLIFKLRGTEGGTQMPNLTSGSRERGLHGSGKVPASWGDQGRLP